MTCPSCGHAVAPTARFCGFCGLEIAGPNAATIAALESSGRHAAVAIRVTDDAVRASDTLNPAIATDISRFAPGTVLAARYRVIGLLGRGGMGDVFRADDLVLGQPVALKFLPDAIAAHPDRIAAFRSEVSVARTVSHPSVCRVYDIGEVDGHPFLTMEYIDGENLSSLLRRIGRLPHDTAVDMARQLCAGLAAAHDKGVLHRDLKPANVMIDGRGKVKLADFGLAALSGDTAHHALAGTPAYMAPELFDRQAPSIASDIYALGLVLYEMFAGKPAFHAESVADMARLHHDSMPTSLSRILTDADPIVDRVIQRCLAKDPAERPASALSVAAALPGGDPLAAALAAGETPSPAMVAAAGGVGALDPKVGLACLVGVIVALIIAVSLSSRTQAARYAPFEKAPAVLADQAASMIRRLGYAERPVDAAYGFTTTDYITYLKEHDPVPSRWQNLRAGQPPGFTFWYRESPQALTTDRFFFGGRVTATEPPIRIPGMVTVMLDLRGRLHQLIAVPPRIDAQAAARAADWSALFREAGLDATRFAPVTPQWTPPSYADARSAWHGVYPDRPDVTIHVEAAASGGQPIFFQIFEPWSTKTLLPRPESGNVAIGRVVSFGAVAGVLLGALLLVQRNLRLGRIDHPGAFRLALVLFVLHVAATLLSAHLNADLAVIGPLLAVVVARGLLIGTLAWISYVALEPDLRRRAPHMLISWNRVLAGRLTDPLVRRDILIGLVGGAGVHLLTQLGYLAPVWFGKAPDTSLPLDGGPPTSIGSLLSVLLRQPASAVLIATSMVLLVFLLKVLLRRRWLVATAFLAFMAVLEMANEGVGVSLAFNMPPLIVITVIVLYFGLLPFVVMNMILPLLDHVPLTFDTSVWYAGYSWTVLAVIAGLALYGYKAAVATRKTLNLDL